ncbi:MAG: PKD domain-containing protein [Bacteroidia bacterium]
MKKTLQLIRKISLFLILFTAWSGSAQASCTASFTWSQSSPNTIAFTSTSAGTSSYTQYSWNYGDGNQGTGATNSHVFNLPGTYSVTLTISDSISGPCRSTVTDTVTVTGSVICALTGSLSSHPPTCSTCNDGAIYVNGLGGGTAPYAYSWNAGGSPHNRLDSGVASGTYTVTITDANACHLTLIDSVRPNSSVCVASFTHTQTAANTIQFTNTSTGTNLNTTYYWTYGDGNYCYCNVTVNHFYNLPGHYTVTLHIADSVSGTCANTHSDTISVTGTVVCAITANITQTNASCNTCADGIASLNVTSGGTAPYTYSWSGGSTPTSSSAQGLAPGTYSVSLTDVNSCHYSQSFTITSRDTNCVPSFTKVQTSANTIQFTSTSHNVSANTTYSWDFGDGSSSGYSFATSGSHVYSAPGLYTACLMIQDSLNGYGQRCSSHICDTVHVSGTVIHHCNASFYLRADSSNAGNYLAINTSTGASSIICSWAWGDGSHDSTVTNPTHQYATAGLYTVCLTIYDGTGCTSTYCDTITAARLPSWLSTHHTSIRVINRMTVTGIREVDALDAWKLFPNPTAGEATVTYSLKSAAMMKVELYDISGRIAYQNKGLGVQDAGVHSLHLDLSNLQAGTYFIRIYANEHVETKLLNLIR